MPTRTTEDRQQMQKEPWTALKKKDSVEERQDAGDMAKEERRHGEGGEKSTKKEKMKNIESTTSEELRERDIDERRQRSNE